MQIYMKHPAHGNAHFAADQQDELESHGWVRWPRTREQKAGIAPAVVAGPVANSEQVDKPKRKPGRPRKDAQ